MVSANLTNIIMFSRLIMYELRVGPQNNDLTESGFGCFDYYRHKTIASFHAVMGCVLSNRLHLFHSEEVRLPSIHNYIRY